MRCQDCDMGVAVSVTGGAREPAHSPVHEPPPSQTVCGLGRSASCAASRGPTTQTVHARHVHCVSMHANKVLHAVWWERKCAVAVEWMQDCKVQGARGCKDARCKIARCKIARCKGRGAGCVGSRHCRSRAWHTGATRQG